MTEPNKEVENVEPDSQVSDKDIDTVVGEAAEIELESKTAERLEQAFSAEEVDPTPEPDEGESEEKPAEETDPTPKEEEEEEVEEVKDEGVVKKDTDETPPISDAYRRAATHRGWTDEEIDALHESNPDLCDKTLSRVYEEVNRASKDFAAIGRQRKEQEVKVEAPATTLVPAPAPPTTAIDMTKLREDVGPDDPVVEAIELMQKQIEAAQSETAQFKAELQQQRIEQPQQVSAAVERERQALGQQIDTYFTGESKLYGDFYGAVAKEDKDWGNLTPGQIANRVAVVEMADQIVMGATTLGREMDFAEGLQLAHMSVSAPLRERVAREKITKEVTKRSKSLTLKPSAATKQEGKATDSKEGLESVTAQRLNKIKWR